MKKSKKVIIIVSVIVIVILLVVAGICVYKFIPRSPSKQIERKLGTSLDDTSNLSLYIKKYGETINDVEYVEISNDDKVEIFKNVKEIKGNLRRQDWLTSYYVLNIKNNTNGKEVTLYINTALYSFGKIYEIDDKYESYTKEIEQIILKYGSEHDFRR